MDDEEALDRSAYLANMKRKGRLAPSRLKELLNAAKGAKAPQEPAPGECCGSSCKPCVLELWRQELRCWKECHPDGEEEPNGDRADQLIAAQSKEEKLSTPKIEIESNLASISLESVSA